MDLTQYSDEELQQIAGIQPKEPMQQQGAMQDISSFSDDELMKIAGISQTQQIEPQKEKITPQQALQFALGKEVEAGKAFMGGLKNFAQKTGTAINQLASELGIDAFSNMAKTVAKLQRPDLKEEFDKYTPEEISNLITKTTEEEVAKREERAGVLSPIAGAGELAGQIGLFGGIEGVGRSAGLQKALEPLEAGEGLKERALKGTLAGAKGYALGKVINTATNAVKSAYKGIKSGISSKYWDDIGQTTIKLKEKASNVYKALNELNGGINQETSKKMANSLDDVLIKSGKLNKRLHGDTLSVFEDLKGALSKGAIGLDDLDQNRQLLNQVILKNTDIAGNLNPDAQKAIVLIKKLDDLVDNLAPNDLVNKGEEAVGLLKLARSDWKTFKKYQKIANVIEKSGADPNRIKSAFKRFVAKKKNLLGFTDLEKKALMRVAQNTSGEKMLKTLGKFGVDLGTSLTPGNTFMPVASIFAGSLSGSTQKGVGFVISGTIARQAQKSLAKGKVVEALQIIEKGGFEDINKIIDLAPTKKAQQELLAKILSYATPDINKNKREK